jgi:hypothetical protein
MRIFLHFLASLAAALWDRDFFHFSALIFFARQQVELLKICLVK